MADELTLAFEGIASVIDVMVLGFASYKALQIRRSLAVGLYRRQALWLAVIAGMYTLLIAESFLFVFLFTTTNPVVDLAVSLSQQVGIVAVFAWTDTSARIARRSDPLLRDSLSWTKIRLLVWAVIAVSTVVTLYFSVVTIISGRNFASAPPFPQLISLSSFLLAPFVAGSILIPLSAARSRDPVLRSHFKWFGVFLLILLTTVLIAIGVIVGDSVTGYIEIVRLLAGGSFAAVAGFFIIVFLAGYTAYRSARSLVPLNRMAEESA